MVIKTYFDKSNTLILDSNINQGFNPITELTYGDLYSRYIFHFNLDYIKKLVCDGTFVNTCKLKHTLHMFNAGAIDFRQMSNYCGFNSPGNPMQRAISFDIILFSIPVEWDGGRGHDHPKNGHIIGDSYISNQGSNWFNSKSGIQWGQNQLGNYTHTSNEPYGGIVNGIYDNNFLQQQYTKYLNGESSIIITVQHFDLGSENLEMDLTDIVNKMLLKPDIFPNNGFCIAFNPFLEIKQVIPAQVITFFTNNTSTWFEPYIETSYQEHINDDRTDFFLDKVNRLYFYTSRNSDPSNLLELPTCTITGNYENGDEFLSDNLEVKQATKGVYYVEFLLPSYNGENLEIESNRMFYDTWDNIKIKKGDTVIKRKAITLDFTTKDGDRYYNFGTGEHRPDQYSVSISGINYNEKIERLNSEIRKVFVNIVYKFTVNQSIVLEDIEYKILKIEGDKEIDVIDWKPVNKSFTDNYFLLDVDSLLPSKYYIKLKIQSNLEIKTYNSINFEIINKEKDGFYN